MEFRDLKRQYAALKDKIDAKVMTTIRDTRYILGPEVEELETALAKYVGRAHCVSCGNGTDALSLALMAYGIGQGDAVFVPDFTFFASAEVIARCGATPLFVDINLKTFNMDPDSLKTAIKTAANLQVTPKAVIAVDLFGLPADYDRIIPICKKHGLILIEDGAQGFGAAIRGKRACSFGDISTTSFFPAKPLGCYGDGGAVFTDDDAIAELLRSLRFHGKGADKYDNVRVGVNSRLDTLQAAVLLVKLNAFEQYELEDVNAIASVYTENLPDSVITPVVPDGYYSSWAQYTILMDGEKRRDGLREYLHANNVPTMVYFPKPMHAQKAFEYLGLQPDCCTEATRACKTVLSLPMGPYLAAEEAEGVARLVCEYFNG